MKIINTLLFLLIIWPGHTAKAELFTHQLKFVQANQVIPVILPHLSSTATLTGQQNNLFAEVSAEDNKKILSMLKMLDKKQTQYLVEVKIIHRKLDDWERKASQIYTGSSLTQAEVKHYSTSALQNSNQHFQLRLMEGSQGFINTQETYPVKQLVLLHQQFLPKTSIGKTTSGFYLIIREKGNNQISLTISAQAQQRQPNSTAINSSSSYTQLTGNKKEWLLLAATGKEQSNAKVTRYTTSTMNAKSKWYYARVTEIN